MTIHIAAAPCTGAGWILRFTFDGAYLVDQYGAGYLPRDLESVVRNYSSAGCIVFCPLEAQHELRPVR